MKTVNIGGVPIKVCSDAEAEQMQYLVCMPAGPSEFEDNLTGFCCKCGTKVMYRWHAPRKPPRICINCILRLTYEEGK